MRHGQARVFGGHSPQAQAHLGHGELNFDVLFDDARHGVKVTDRDQAACPAQDAVRQHDVLAAVADHFHDALLQRLDFFAQHLGLALLQAHGPVAVRAGELHGGQQFGMAQEKVGRIGQVVGNIVFGDGVVQCLVHKVSGRSISP